ncbi:MAG: NAD(P)-binding domain-containing protein [Planctomycetia bacterium]|nr:NAD(P)-binding domain-containing protein [Planctomycetia bacterium]
MEKFCIVGAGSSGLAAAKAFVEAGIPFDCLEREDDVGGNWYYGRPQSSVYASTHTISSKRLTEYVDFPMPADYPEYPHHRQVWDYLKAYAQKFGLYERIEFGRTIERIERSGDRAAGGWTVRLADGSERRYRGIVVANGHNWKPRLPSFVDKLSATVLHSSQYKTPDVFVGKRVLVVGAGNSGCDIAVEAAQHAERTLHSTRRGYHYLPKFWRGMPIDALNEKLLRYRLPKPVRRWLGALVERVSFGPAGSYGLPKPDHRLFESHPIINQQLFYYLAHGRIQPKPDVAALDTQHDAQLNALSGAVHEVRFSDGTREQVDVVVLATGFQIAFPFLDSELLNWHGGKPRLFLNVFHPTADDLFVVGLIQPDSGQFGLVDYQAQLVARYVAACDRRRPEAERFRRLKTDADLALDGGMRYLATERHLLEVEHFSYRRKLQKLLATLPPR